MRGKWPRGRQAEADSHLQKDSIAFLMTAPEGRQSFLLYWHEVRRPGPGSCSATPKTREADKDEIAQIFIVEHTF